MEGWAMMALVGMILFTAALGVVLHVVALTLWPALPRMAALLASDDAQLQPIAPRSIRAGSVIANRGRPVERHRAMALAA